MSFEPVHIWNVKKNKGTLSCKIVPNFVLDFYDLKTLKMLGQNIKEPFHWILDELKTPQCASEIY